MTPKLFLTLPDFSMGGRGTVVGRFIAQPRRQGDSMKLMKKTSALSSSASSWSLTYSSVLGEV